MAKNLESEKRLWRGRPRPLLLAGLMMAILACSTLNTVGTQAPSTEVTGSTAGASGCSIFESIPAAAQYDAAPPQLIDVSANYSAT